VKIALQLVVVVVFASIATWIFATPGDSFARLVFAYPVLPGAVAGLLFSGHGGNPTIALTSAIVINSVIWCVAWLGLRALVRAVRG
jgi:hypothetical protein